MAFDIMSTAVDETATLELTDANEAPMIDPETKKQCTITLYGPGSEPFARAEAKRQNRLLERMKRKGKAEMSPEEQRAEQASFLASVTVSFDGFSYPPAAELTGKDLFKAVYMDRRVGFITDQVQRFVGDWGNFTGKDGPDQLARHRGMAAVHRCRAAAVAIADAGPVEPGLCRLLEGSRKAGLPGAMDARRSGNAARPRGARAEGGDARVFESEEGLSGWA
jgi:hypothetical protein